MEKDRDVFTKLHAWRQTQFNTVVFVDSDILVWDRKRDVLAVSEKAFSIVLIGGRKVEVHRWPSVMMLLGYGTTNCIWVWLSPSCFFPSPHTFRKYPTVNFFLAVA